VDERDDLAAAVGPAEIDLLEHRGTHDGGARLSGEKPSRLEPLAALRAQQLRAEGDHPESIALRGDDLAAIHDEFCSRPPKP